MGAFSLKKKASFTGAFSLFSGVGWCGAWSALGVSRLGCCGLGFGFALGLGAWASAGVGAGGPLWWWACGGPVFHPSSLKISVRLKKTGRVGIGAVHIFESTPPPISCRGIILWGCGLGWGRLCKCREVITHKKPTSSRRGWMYNA